jgi:HAD superfamily hydrolase (TIGR01509 family)
VKRGAHHIHGESSDIVQTQRDPMSPPSNRPELLSPSSVLAPAVAMMPVSAGMLQHSGIDRPVEQIIDMLVDQVVDAISPRIPWLPGAERLLGDLADAGIPCALVTMAYSPVAHRVAAAAPGNAICAVIAGNDVTRGKPHPEPYLQAAAKLGVSPADCVAIEDSLNGTLSAEAARIPVLVVPGIVSVPKAPGRTFTTSLADITVDTLRDLVTAHSE